MTDKPKRSSRRGVAIEQHQRGLPKGVDLDNIDRVAEGVTLIDPSDSVVAESKNKQATKAFFSRLPPDLHDRLTWLAKHRPESMNEIVVNAVQKEVDRLFEPTKKMIELYESTL